jgi:Uma2 family endonuclease
MIRALTKFDNIEVGNSITTQRVSLSNVSWQTYMTLLKDVGISSGVRFAYDSGVLEIIMPSSFHELINRLLALIITTLTDELDMSIRNYGSTTLNREDLDAGAEPDSCFYIQNYGQLKGVELDISTDPSPDLVVEVDLTSLSSRRLNIYRKLGISEVWLYTKHKGLTIYQLQDGKYVECDFSPTFVMVSGSIIDRFVQQADVLDDNAIARSVRQWLRSQAPST